MRVRGREVASRMLDKAEDQTIAPKGRERAGGPMGKRTNWLDKDGDIAIDDMAKRLGSFIDTMADGVVTGDELEAQEDRVVALMKEIEPKLDDELHERITTLLCELTAFDIMQLLNSVQEARSETVWRP